MRRTISLLAVLSMGLPTAGFAQQPRYSDSWKDPSPQSHETQLPARSSSLDALLKELKQLTREAAKHRAADPQFLSYLKDLARRYSWPWKELIVSDQFHDGEYGQNPAWRVVSGSFDVRRQGLITSTDAADRHNSNRSQRRNKDDFAKQILGDILQDLSGGKRKNKQRDRRYQRPTKGTIYPKAHIPNQFAIMLKLRAKASQSGVFEVGIGQGKKASGYYFRYEGGQYPSRSLLKKHRRGQAVIEQVADQVHLEDGKLHDLLITRGRRGRLTVTIDGETKIRIRDRSFRDPFDKFVLTNYKGTYAIKSVAIYGASRR
jgi:hypothetical protein